MSTDHDLDRLDPPQLDAWFVERLDPDLATAHELARVVSVHRSRYVVLGRPGELPAELSGSMLHAKTNELLGDRRVSRVVFKLKR